MLRGMLGSVKGEKSENPKGEGEIRQWKRGEIKLINLIGLCVIIINLPF